MMKLVIILIVLLLVSFAACNQVNHLIPTRVLVKGGEITCKMLK
ncbi:type I toxin-antitoxin system Ibs family toxin [Escherichia coli]|nr:type I toxin-antitoxin system Ibs family toxin [Escherichia coli]